MIAAARAVQLAAVPVNGRRENCRGPEAQHPESETA